MLRISITLHDPRGAKVPRYMARIPAHFKLFQVVAEALLYWNVDASVARCELYDDRSEIVRLETSLDQLQCFNLDLVLRSSKHRRGLTPQELVHQVFLVHAVQNPWGQSQRINLQQFKAMTKRIAVVRMAETQKTIAFKAHASCARGLSFKDFLAALNDITDRSGNASIFDFLLDKSTVVKSLKRFSLFDDLADAAAVVAARNAFTKPLLRLMGSFHHANGAPICEESTRLSFAEFCAFVNAVQLKKRFKLSTDDLATLFVHCFHLDNDVDDCGEVRVSLHRLLWAFTHIGLVVTPQLMALGPAESEQYGALLSKRQLQPQYAAMCVKIVFQEIAHALTSRDVDAICSRHPSGHEFRKGAQDFHRCFVASFQHDRCADYVAVCRSLSTQPIVSNQAAKSIVRVDNQDESADCKNAVVMASLDVADELLEAIVVEIDENDEPDLDFVADQWLAASEAYDKHLAEPVKEQASYAGVLLRYASSISVCAQQIWRAAIAKPAKLGLPALYLPPRRAAIYLHACWASLCLNDAVDDDGELVLQCVLQWAHCLVVAGEVISFQTDRSVDAKLVATLSVAPVHPNQKIELWSVHPDATAATYFNEARLRYLLVVDMVPSLTYVSHLVTAQIHLALHVPLGCAVARELFQDALDHLADFHPDETRSIVASIEGLIFVRHAFFTAIQPGAPLTVTPFFRFIVSSIFKEFAAALDCLAEEAMNQINLECGWPPLSSTTLEWLWENFDTTCHGAIRGLSQVGFMDYLKWMAQADPATFHRVLTTLIAATSCADASPIPSDLLSSIHDFCHQDRLRNPKTPRRSCTPRENTFPRFAIDRATPQAIADCFVVLSSVIKPLSSSQIPQTSAASDIGVMSQMTDKLTHPSCSAFQVPDVIGTFLHPLPVVVETKEPPPRWFDTVLTDVKGIQIYVACLHFAQRTTAVELKALLYNSAADVSSNDKAAIPSWLEDTAAIYFLPKSLVFLSRLPCFKALHIALWQIYRSQQIQSKVIGAFMTLPMPPSPLDKTLCVFYDHYFLVHPVDRAMQFAATEVDFTLLFQRLDLTTIVDVLLYLICEKKVAMAAKSMAMLTPVMQTLRALLRPFQSQVVYIPAVTEALSDLLCSPVPFFVGISATKLALRHELDDVVLVDLDSNNVLLPPRCLLPRLSDRTKRKLVKSLSQYCERVAIVCRDEKHHMKDEYADLYGVIDTTTARSSPLEVGQVDEARWQSKQIEAEEYTTEVWNGLQTVVSAFLLSLIRDYNKYIDWTNRFDSKAYLRDFPHTRQVCSHLFETQLFQDFLDRNAQGDALRPSPSKKRAKYNVTTVRIEEKKSTINVV
ncbi:unnamed protein product [Aphanomyces euteiches]